MPSANARSRPPAAEPDVRKEEVGDAEPPTARSPIVEAACRAVVGMFDQLATEWPELIRAQAPPESLAPQFTQEMMEQLGAQLRRALGIGPEPPK